MLGVTLYRLPNARMRNLERAMQVNEKRRYSNNHGNNYEVLVKGKHIVRTAQHSTHTHTHTRTRSIYAHAWMHIQRLNLGERLLATRRHRDQSVPR